MRRARGNPPPLSITRAGLEAIGVESVDEEAQAPVAATERDTGAMSAAAAGAEGRARGGESADTQRDATASRMLRAGTSRR